MAPQRPQLKPALRRVWRDSSTLQLGVDAAHAVVIGGLDRGAVRVLESLDGSRDLAGVAAIAARVGISRERLDELLALLNRSGVLEDAAADQRPLAALDLAERDRLAPDLAAASLLHPGGAVAVLAARRRAVVQVWGAGRVGASVVTLLAAAGVGAVVVDDAGTTRPGDVAPAGVAPDDIGSRRQDAALRAARRLAPSLRSTLPSRRSAPDLAVLAGPPDGADFGLGDRLLRLGVPHLIARVRETTGVVGPLVLPGRSSCQRCHDLHRADRDPAWPSIAAQLSAGSRSRTGACDTVLATAVAAHAALQVLAYVDGDPTPPAVDGTLEIRQADGLVRRRTWVAHPSCGCTWDHRIAEPA